MKKFLIGIVAGVFISSIFCSWGTTAPEEKKLKVGLCMTDTLENVWNRTIMLALDELKNQDYPFELRYVERLTRETMESAIRSFAAQGYDVIIVHASEGPDIVARVHDEFPNIAFLGGGSGWKPLEPNVGIYDQAIHESAYLCGVIAGMMTKTNVLGTIGAFPIPSVNSIFNAYKRGALSVNPKVKLKVSYIESWYDPVKAKEAALAQISAGADYILAERDGVFQGCQEKGVYAFGDKIDQHEVAPNTVVTCALINWAPVLKKAFDRVRAGNFKAESYTRYVGSMADGTTALAPYYTFEKKLPQKVKEKVAEVTKKIKDGSLVVPYEGKEKVKAD